MVDALHGAPGVYSARYGHKESDAARTAYLLENMKDVPDEARTAKFVCVITCLWPDGRKIVARGECPGRILHEVLGTLTSVPLTKNTAMGLLSFSAGTRRF